MRDAMIGSKVNRYEIRESLHRSDLIGIYKAYDTKLERLVLLKTILHSTDYSKDAVDFFITESRSLAQLTHPNIAKVLDFGHENGNLYLISEFVTGIPLSELMLDGPMPWQKAVNILLPLMDALIYAHSKDIIHRDLKPENITVNSDGQPTLSDFSLIRIIEEEETRDMTGTNVGLGSAAYISPEQGKGLTVDFRADIYSLGVIFFEMVTGKKLFYAANSMEIVLQHIMANPPKPRTIVPELPKSIEDAILNALSKDPDKRYQSMDEFSNVLKAIVEASNRAKSKPKTTIDLRIASAIGIALIVVVVFVIRAWERTPAVAVPTPTFTEPRATPTAIFTVTKTVPAPITPTPTQLSEIELFPKYDFSPIPIVPGESLPTGELITTENAGSILELARWGIPDIYEFTFTDNGNVLLAATSAGIYYFDPKDLSVRHFFDTEGQVTTLAVSDDGTLVATGDTEGILAVWNIQDGTRIRAITSNPPAQIEAIDIAPDNSELIFSDTKNKRIYRWNFDQSQPQVFENRVADVVHTVKYLRGHNDIKTVVSGGKDAVIGIWDAPTGVLLETYTASRSRPILDMAISSDGNTLIAALIDGRIQVWDITKPQNAEMINELVTVDIETPITHIAFLADNQTAVAGLEKGMLQFWNVNLGEKEWETPAKTEDKTSIIGQIKTLAVSSDGSRLVVMFGNGLIELWDTNNRQMETSRLFHYEEIKRIAISPNSKIIAAQNGDPVLGISYVEILSATDSTQIAQISGSLPRGEPISPDDRTIIIQTDVLELGLYSLTNRPKKNYTLYNFPLDGTVAYMSNNRIVAASARQTLSYWSIASGLELTVDDKQKRIKDGCIIYYQRDGKILAGGSLNGTLYISDQNVLDKFCSVPRRPAATSEDFLPDGSIIVMSAKNSPIVDVWDLRNDSLKIEIISTTEGNYVLDTAISNDGMLLAVASTDGSIKIFDLSNLEDLNPIRTMESHTGPINQVLFTQDGKYIISGSTDGTIRVFGLNP